MPPGWWTANRESNLLILNLTRTNPLPVSTVDAVDAKFREFEKTYLELLEILQRVGRAADVLDNLKYCALHQTLDEYYDFEYDRNALRANSSASGGNAGCFSRPQLESPHLLYQVARYVYTDEGVKHLLKKIDWQILIMRETVNETVLTYMQNVHKPLEHPQQDGDDEKVFHSGTDSGDPLLRLIGSLKARIQEANTSSGSTESIDEKTLAENLRKYLADLKEKFPKFITRKRAYFDAELSSTSDTRKVATMSAIVCSAIWCFYADGRSKIQPTDDIFNPTIIDIVSYGLQRIIVSTEESEGIGVQHRLPSKNIVYPSTNHRRIAGSAHDTEVGTENECVVDITRSVSETIHNALPLYNFPSASDMMTFQSALVDKFIRHTFDVDEIRSERGLETSFEHLKLWSDYKDRNHSLSFSKNKNGSEVHLEYPLECFESKPEPNQKNARFIIIYFRPPPESVKEKRTSQALASHTKRNAPKASSPAKSRSPSSEIPPAQSPSPSRMKFFKRHSSEDSTTQLSPSGKSHNRGSPSSASTNSQLSTSSATGSNANLPVARNRIFHPDATSLLHLDIRFSSLEGMYGDSQGRDWKSEKKSADKDCIPDADLFRSKFPAAIQAGRRPHVKSPIRHNEPPPLPESRQQTARNLTTFLEALPPSPGPQSALSLTTSPEALSPTPTKEGVPSISVPKGSGRSVKSVVFGKETDRRLSHGSSNPNSDDEDGHQPYTFAVPGGEREAAPTMNHHGKASSVSFPVERGTGSSLSRRETFTSMTPSVASRPKREDYKVGWICAVQIEHVIVLEILDEEFQAPLDIPARDDNLYSFGRIADHNIVVGCLPQGKYGTASAASVAVNMLRSFERIRIGLLVGIGGGAPSKKHDIRLGDVVVSSPAGQNGGIFHYEFGKAIQDKTFEHTGLMASPPSILLSAMQVLGTSHVRRGHKISSTINALLEKNERLVDQYKKPNASSDVLFQSSLTHPEGNENCEWCIQNTDKIVDRKQRNPKADDPVVHYGLIASADHLMKDANTRDLLVKEKDVLCFEMEAAGLDRFPCVVIRGICDYSDTHKNDIWQGYAAATAAAYAKELLQVIPPHQVRQAEAAAGAYFMKHSPELHSESLGPVDLDNLSSLEKA